MSVQKSRIIFLTNNANAFELFSWISVRTEAYLLSEVLSVEQLARLKPDLIISYNYSHIIKEDIIDFMEGNIINLHISYLPWNRGSDPNFWSFVENTPKGVTIHKVAKGLDTGDIIYQKQLHFEDENETFQSSYNKLQFEIEKLFKENFDDIISSNYIAKPQDLSVGSYHLHKQFLEYTREHDLSWDMRIKDYLSERI